MEEIRKFVMSGSDDLGTQHAHAQKQLMAAAVRQQQQQQHGPAVDKRKPMGVRNGNCIHNSKNKDVAVIQDIEDTDEVRLD